MNSSYLVLGRKGQSGHPAPQHPLLVELIVFPDFQLVF